VAVVDDEDQDRRELGRALVEAGYEVVEASNGEEALALLKKQDYELMIIDLFMPEKEGIETIREIHRDYPAVKIIAISGMGRLAPEMYLETARRLGAHHTLTKPIQHDKLLEAVVELLPPDTKGEQPIKG
jgi:CheY-like chemotaxis protein